MRGIAAANRAWRAAARRCALCGVAVLHDFLEQLARAVLVAHFLVGLGEVELGRDLLPFRVGARPGREHGGIGRRGAEVEADLREIHLGRLGGARLRLLVRIEVEIEIEPAARLGRGRGRLRWLWFLLLGAEIQVEVHRAERFVLPAGDHGFVRRGLLKRHFRRAVEKPVWSSQWPDASELPAHVFVS